MSQCRQGQGTLKVNDGTEVAQAWIDYAFHEMNVPVVCALVEKANTASIHVLEKVGMKQLMLLCLTAKNTYGMKSRTIDEYCIGTKRT